MKYRKRGDHKQVRRISVSDETLAYLTGWTKNGEAVSPAAALEEIVSWAIAAEIEKVIEEEDPDA